MRAAALGVAERAFRARPSGWVASVEHQCCLGRRVTALAFHSRGWRVAVAAPVDLVGQGGILRPDVSDITGPKIPASDRRQPAVIMRLAWGRALALTLTS
ncbi:hypothetical protein Prum_017450 [Phytohabitans rumicis]|uniref:Uncharacterized protein n=1 Tax=Phytohabitans rumicis TaxID=1076125 RepID=A0A6V8KSI5_9ACTN|nr:hypothetical protein Prum_017450 [Phytohabitans rumicis]